MKSKRLFAFVAAIMMMFSLCAILPVKVSVLLQSSAEFKTAEYTTGTYEQLSYRNYGDHIEITDCDYGATDVVIPAEIEGLPVISIKERAFQDCTGLTSVEIPDSITEIEIFVFNGCKSLTSITIPNSVTEIRSGAFYGCISLTSITIPDSVTYIAGYSSGMHAFAGCKSLTSINVSENNKNYADIDGVLFNKDKTSLISYPFGRTETEYTVPTGVKYITYCAFSSYTVLTSVIIPESVTSIHEYAFNQTSLESITILNPKCDIKDYCFRASTIYGYENSTAQEYAEKYNYKFESLGEAPETSTYGDANGDGTVNIADAVVLQKFLLGTGNLTNWENIDLCKDGKIDVFDMVEMRKLIINQSAQ